MGHGLTYRSRSPAKSISLSGSLDIFCPVHIHNVVAQKRDASAELLQRFGGFDFGGDFNMSAFRVFSDTEFSAPGNSFLCGLWCTGVAES